jgi:hypothetical protein
MGDLFLSGSLFSSTCLLKRIHREGREEREAKQGGWMQEHSQTKPSLIFAFFAPFALNNSCLLGCGQSPR